jgi:hypothetical protein
VAAPLGVQVAAARERDADGQVVRHATFVASDMPVVVT